MRYNLDNYYFDDVSVSDMGKTKSDVQATIFNEPDPCELGQTASLGRA